MMIDAQECPTLTGGDAVHLYVAGSLPAEEVERFEVHLLGCARCRAAVLQGAAISAALRPSRRRSSWRHMLWALPLAAAVAGMLLMRPPNPLRSLGGVAAAPRFAGAPVRAASDRAALLLDSGMAAYSAGQWKSAARLLAAAGEAGPAGGGPAPAFYLGAARLMAGDAAGALVAFERASSPGGPYAADASYYRAKAWLRLGNADSALAALRTSAADTVAAPRARALEDSVRRAQRR